MNTYCAQSFEDGTLFDHTFQAEDDDAALLIADARGWEIIGELICEQIVYESEVDDVLDYLQPDKLH